MIRPPPEDKKAKTHFPNTKLFRSQKEREKEKEKEKKKDKNKKEKEKERMKIESSEQIV